VSREVRGGVIERGGVGAGDSGKEERYRGGRGGGEETMGKGRVGR